MLVELVTTGSELLLGEIVNVNSQYLSQELNRLGYSVVYHTTVGDNPQRMEQVLRTALSRADIVITTGGLGPRRYDEDHRGQNYGRSLGISCRNRSGY